MKNALSRAAAVGAVAIATLCETPCLVLPASAMAPPTGQVLTVVDFPPTPATLPELLKAVDLAVLARVETTSRAQADRSGPSPKIRRIQDLTVLEVLKGETRGPRIKVRQIGGTVSVDGKDYSADYPVRLLEVGDVVVLFLHRVPTPEAVYDIAYGADGAVWARGPDQETALPPGLRKMPEFAGSAPQRLPALLATVRAAKKDGKCGQPNAVEHNSCQLPCWRLPFFCP
jgi:hypothetical protein